MFSVFSCPLPADALLAVYRRDGAHTDCYATDIDGAATHAQYVAAFYTTPVFKLERFILKWLAARPSTDAQAEQLAAGTVDGFAAWRVEHRSADQLLMCDFLGRTRSWLMVAPLQTANGAGTRLYFGSAVVPVPSARTGQPTLGWTYRFLLGFHKAYSQVLLHAASARLMTAPR